MAEEHTKNARNSTHDKHTGNHDSTSEKKRDHDSWHDRGNKDKDQKKQ
jgi:hypothetical protein